MRRRWYLKGIGQHPLLSGQEEMVLCMDVQELQRWNQVRSNLELLYNREPTQTEWSAAVGFSGAGEAIASSPKPEEPFDAQLNRLRKAKERMINSNLRLVVSIAKGYANRGLNLQDLIQEGTLGLMTAVDKFDPLHHSQAKFSSYASWWIKQRVSRAVGKAGAIRLPARMPSMIATVAKARDDFRMAMGREPSHDELAEAAGISEGRLRLILSATREPVSLDCQVMQSSSDTRTLADTLPDVQPSPDERLESRMNRQTLARALNTGKNPILDAEEHAVICSAYNLIEDRSHPLSHEQIAQRFGKSVEWVAKVEQRALKKIKGRPQLRNLLATRNVGNEYMASSIGLPSMNRKFSRARQREIDAEAAEDADAEARDPFLPKWAYR